MNRIPIDSGYIDLAGAIIYSWYHEIKVATRKKDWDKLEQLQKEIVTVDNYNMTGIDTKELYWQAHTEGSKRNGKKENTRDYYRRQAKNAKLSKRNTGIGI